MSSQIKTLGAAAAVGTSASSAFAAPASYGYRGRAWAIEPFSDPLQLERACRIPYTGYSERDFQVPMPGN
jgi:hypothetical protein